MATWRHWHGWFPGGYDNPDDPEGPPIEFTNPDPDPDAVRDYNGAALRQPEGHPFHDEWRFQRSMSKGNPVAGKPIVPTQPCFDCGVPYEQHGARQPGGQQ